MAIVHHFILQSRLDETSQTRHVHVITVPALEAPVLRDLHRGIRQTHEYRSRRIPYVSQVMVDVLLRKLAEHDWHDANYPAHHFEVPAEHGDYLPLAEISSTKLQSLKEAHARLVQLREREAAIARTKELLATDAERRKNRGKK